MKFRNNIIFYLMIPMILFLTVIYSNVVSAEDNTKTTALHWRDYDGKRIGVLTGTL